MQLQYPDRYLRIIGYPVLGFIIRHFGEYESIGSLMKKPLYYADLAWDTLIVALTWEANRHLILYLDKRYSWVEDKFQRFVMQAAGALVITVPLVAGMIYLWNEVIIKRPGNFDTGYLLVYDFPLTIIFTTLVHMIYLGFYLTHYYRSTVQSLENRIRELESTVAGVGTTAELLKPSGYRDILVVNYGSSNVPVQTSDIAYIAKVNDLCLLKTFDGKEYSSSSSLESLEALLDPFMFFRINRQMLANIKAIKQFKADAAGKLLLSLNPAYTDEVSISKKKAPEFRAWVGQRV